MVLLKVSQSRIIYLLLNSVALDINAKTQADVIYTDFKKHSTCKPQIFTS